MLSGGKWNEILGSQYKGFAINMYIYIKSYKTQKEWNWSSVN